MKRTSLKSYALLLLILLCILMKPATLSAAPPTDEERKQMRAIRVEGVASPRIDGRLDDAVWEQAEFLSDFLQKEPVEGGQPSDSTRVAIAYDDDAIYVGARMFTDEPEAIRQHVNRRDDPGGAEQIILSLDTYRDRRTSYDFCVTSSGVRMDRYHSEDIEHQTDYSFDVVWEAKAHVDSLGWSAEMRIPFSQLRFSDEPEQVWGINWNRWIPAKNEDVFWVYVPRNETGWSSYFGNLVGISNVASSSRIELLPYLAGDATFVDRNPQNPFDDEFEGQIGGDLKMGLGPNLTLDATINPDFGQVEADPAEVNLSAFETFFEERRPFFVEGSQLFEAFGPSYYYSRRIGAEPHGDVDADFADASNATTIPAAAKLTGRLQSGLSVGGLLAVTAREYASTFDIDTVGPSHDSIVTARERHEIEPPAAYGVLRLQQELGDDASTVGLILTGLGRDLDGGRLSTSLRRHAYSGGLDWNWRLNNGQYELRGYAGFSHIRGEQAAILEAQESSARYYQRPDAGHVDIDPSRTSMTGYVGSLRINRQSGRHWLWGGGITAETPDFEINDMGILSTADDLSGWGWIRYRETQPGKLFRRYSAELHHDIGFNFGGVRQYTNLNLNLEATWHNYMTTYMWIGGDAPAYSDNMTRGGPLMREYASVWTGAGVNSNFAATTRVSAEIDYSRNEGKGWDYSLEGDFVTRGDRWSFSISPEYGQSNFSRQYITQLDGGPDATFGKRYIFSWIRRSELAARLRLNYFFTPDLSLEVYAEPFAASGRYYDHGELRAARTADLRTYGVEEGTTIEPTDDGYRVTDGDETFAFRNADFGYLSFRSNVVLRWEFRPGSTLFFVWQQNREGSDDPGRLVRPGLLFDTFSAAGRDFLAVKISYWVPVS
ncbi:MAG: hypothetical protein GF341_07050 [candidate division Zixibacteria bacterium]|nr:hypothetical protein [candidate division Zixibacteria bacterium]